MSDNPSQSVDAMFGEVLALSPAERSAHLDTACGGDAALRRRIEELLSAHEQAGNFMASPAFQTKAITPAARAEK